MSLIYRSPPKKYFKMTALCVALGLVLCIATITAQPPHPQTFTYYYADISSTMTLPNGHKQHGKGVAAYDSKVRACGVRGCAIRPTWLPL